LFIAETPGRDRPHRASSVLLGYPIGPGPNSEYSPDEPKSYHIRARVNPADDLAGFRHSVIFGEDDITRV
jgi:hypothetical protein